MKVENYLLMLLDVLKILNPEQMLQRLTLGFVRIEQVAHPKLCKNIYSLYQAKNISKNVFHKIMNSVKV